jgi:membrane protease YdiL (CAAX protease family)
MSQAQGPKQAWDQQQEIPRSGDPAKPRQSRRRVQLLAVALGPLPVYALLFISGYLSEQPYSPQDFFLYATVISGPIIVALLLLLRFLCGEKPRQLNLKPGTWASDLLATIILSVVTLAANVLSMALLSGLLPSPPNTGVVNLFRWLNQNPGMLALFLGLLLWIGVAQEELTRVFLLSRLWKVWSSTTAKLAVVLLAACLFGLSHAWQGPARIVWTGIYGLIMSLYYLRFGRVWPMIASHYFTNALQVVVFVLRMPPEAI